MTRKYIIESLSIIKAAIYSATSNKNNLRDNQLISCLLMLNSFENSQRKGRLFQISTGEGKSTIICAVAIVLALKGHKVDIVTTTSILAERDA
jgi:DNA replication protein DnaC